MNLENLKNNHENEVYVKNKIPLDIIVVDDSPLKYSSNHTIISFNEYIKRCASGDTFKDKFFISDVRKLLSLMHVEQAVVGAKHIYR